MTEYKQKILDNQALTSIDASYLAALKADLLDTVTTYSGFEKEASRLAKNKIRLAFATCFTQFTAMSVGIYGVSDWNTVEPTTFLVTAFWLMCGSGFFIKNRVDFSWESAFDYFTNKELAKLI